MLDEQGAMSSGWDDLNAAQIEFKEFIPLKLR